MAGWSGGLSLMLLFPDGSVSSKTIQKCFKSCKTVMSTGYRICVLNDGDTTCYTNCVTEVMSGTGGYIYVIVGGVWCRADVTASDSVCPDVELWVWNWLGHQYSSTTCHISCHRPPSAAQPAVQRPPFFHNTATGHDWDTMPTHDWKYKLHVESWKYG